MTNRIRPILLAALLFGGVGCTTYVVPPPAAGASGLPVFVADYGYHSTIVLPRTRGGMIEYAYGDWTYFGLNQKSLGTGLHAMLASEQATIGRRVIDRSPDQPGLRETLGADFVLRFAAPRERVAELEQALERRFSARVDSLQFSPAHHLYFVKDDEPYGIGHNCNHFTAGWLEQLGCKIEGVRFASKFRLREGPAEGPATAPTIAPDAAQLASAGAPWILGPPKPVGHVPTTQARSHATTQPARP